VAELAAAAGLRRIQILAWRDLEDPEAGGSEIHASTIAGLWSAAGLDVTMRTSAVAGRPVHAWRDGYRVVRRAGRYAVFPRAIAGAAADRRGRPDGLVEIWNGMPFFSPLWARSPHIVFLHHVHADMWAMAITQPGLARLGRTMECRLAPRVYRDTRIVTLSPSSRAEIIERLGLPAGNINVVPPGIHPRFSPGPGRSPHPLVAAVGRLVPVKRFDALVDLLVELRRRHPDMVAVIAGEGYERPALSARIRQAGAEGWLHLPGRLDDDELLRLYRRAWVVASTSVHEGWGMTLTEAAACATPAVASAIPGHVDSVSHGTTGLLAPDARGLLAGLDAVLSDAVLRRRLGAGASARATGLRWEMTARGTMAALAAEAQMARRRAAVPEGRTCHVLPARPAARTS
jgi:glycosyltransferase involved in cell wall biosynthesis